LAATRPIPEDVITLARKPILLTIATLLGVWFGVTAPHVSPVTPPAPPPIVSAAPTTNAP
jgi:hypothetical protein